jgi:hypothetical protein
VYKPVDRLEFLKSMGRAGMMIGMGGLGIAAVRGSRTVKECFNHNYCASCWVYHGCELPKRNEASNERDKGIQST